MFSMERNTASEKMQTYPRYIFFHGSQHIAQNTEEKKVDVFSIAI